MKNYIMKAVGVIDVLEVDITSAYNNVDYKMFFENIKKK